jgi:hypothetical protein
MKKLLLESFEQNPDALAKLLATGNATLTHTQDKGKWGTEFPRLLMEVRGELRVTQPSTQPTTVKEGVSELFESNPELANIGTPQQYTEWINYLTTQGELAGTEATDILYHGSEADFETFILDSLGNNTKAKDADRGFAFSTDKKTAKTYGKNIKSVILNAQNIEKVSPISEEYEDIIKPEFQSLKEQIRDLKKLIVEQEKINNINTVEKLPDSFYVYSEKSKSLVKIAKEGTAFYAYVNNKKINEKINDKKVLSLFETTKKDTKQLVNKLNLLTDKNTVFLYKNIIDNRNIENTSKTDVYFAKPEQIYILGGKKDTEGFKEFVSGQPSTQPTTVKEGVSELFESNPELASIGTSEQYSQYLDTIFPDSKVKDIVYRGEEKEDSRLFQYWTNNKAEAYMYAKANVTKGGSITERNPISAINQSAKTYFNDKYGEDSYRALMLPDDFIESFWYHNYEENEKGEVFLNDINQKKLDNEKLIDVKKQALLKIISDEDKQLLKNIKTIEDKYDDVKIESEADLTKPYDDTRYQKNIDEYNKARKYIDNFLGTENIREKIGNIKTALLNITNPYKDEIVQEDLQNNIDAYKNGHDGALLMGGDHFLVKSNTKQIHILGSKQDIEGFKNFISSSPNQTTQLMGDLYTVEEQTKILDHFRTAPQYKNAYSNLSNDDLIAKINIKLADPEKRNTTIELLNNCFK